ncbi:hypothetical protein ACIBCH_11330 [Amycolatopsis thailandensis]|uniref:hypothetical protein n=1 Tax=Amycolatopsis thailandensis TaxID=589330 RepID=UPI0037B1897E
MNPTEDATELPATTIAKGLATRPAYLLIFGVSFTFATASGAGFTVGLSNSVPSITITSAIVFIIALLSCLTTAYKSITLSEQQALSAGDLRPQMDVPNGQPPSTTEEGEGVLNISFPETLDSDFGTAIEVFLFGVHQSHILIRYYNLIQEKLQKGCRMRILLLDPNCTAAVKMTAMRFPGEALEQQELSRIQSSLSNYKKIQEKYPQLVEIRVIPFLLPYGGFMFNWSTDEAAVHIQRYTFQVQGGSHKPKFSHKGKGDRWLHLYRAEVLAMWDAAAPIN